MVNGIIWVLIVAGHIVGGPYNNLRTCQNNANAMIGQKAECQPAAATTQPQPNKVCVMAMPGQFVCY